MTQNSKFFDSIRIRSKKTEEKPRGPVCQWDGCDKPGTHKAPVGRMKENEYFHFCIDHVREYNKGFNYFSGMPDGDIAKLQKDALTGNRPTWNMGTTGTGAKAAAAPEFAKIRSGRAAYQNRMRDPLSMFTEAKAPTGIAKNRKPRTLETKALETLGLTSKATSSDIKTAYKELVKAHHPDANGGDRGSEDRFRDVIQAYQLLKQAGFC